MESGASSGLPPKKEVDDEAQTGAMQEELDVEAGNEELQEAEAHADLEPDATQKGNSRGSGSRGSSRARGAPKLVPAAEVEESVVLEPRSAWSRGPPAGLFERSAASSSSTKSKNRGGSASSTGSGNNAGQTWPPVGDEGYVKQRGDDGGRQPGAKRSHRSHAPILQPRHGVAPSGLQPRAHPEGATLGAFMPRGAASDARREKSAERGEEMDSDVEVQIWPPPSADQEIPQLRGRRKAEEKNQGHISWPPPQEQEAGSYEAYPPGKPPPGGMAGDGAPVWGAWGGMPGPYPEMPPGPVPEASAKQIIDAFCRLDGSWRGYGAYGLRQWHEIILEPVLGHPEETRLLCRTWTDGRPGEQRKMIYYAEGNILFGNGQIYLDTIGPRRAIWKDWYEPDIEWQWLRGW